MADRRPETPRSPSPVIFSGIDAKTLKECIVNLFKGLWNLFYAFFSFSSLHGFMHITKEGRHTSERLFWAIVVGLAFWGAITLGLQTLRRFQENPTVVSMERNYKEWNTSFPSVAICPLAKFSEENIMTTLEEFDYVKDKSGLRKFLRELSQASYGTFDQVSDFSQLKRTDYWQGLVKIKFPFKYKVSNSNPENYNVFRMNPFMSEAGLCYSYNSDCTYYNDPAYWEQDRWSSLGRFLTFRSSPLDGDIFAQVRNMNSGYEMYVFNPSEFPDIALAKMSADNNTYKTLDLTALSIVSTKAAESLSINQRKCRLQHESNLITSPIYSYNLCRMECRMKTCFKLCSCVPFFYRPTGKYPICDYHGMQCLQKYTDELVRLIDSVTGKRIHCKCYPLCNEVNYFVDAETTMMWSLGTNLKVGLIKYPRFRLKRDVIFGATDLMVSIGGTAGLFLGCSILSLAELVYYFLARPFYYWRYRLPLQFT